MTRDKAQRLARRIVQAIDEIAAAMNSTAPGSGKEWDRTKESAREELAELLEGADEE